MDEKTFIEIEFLFSRVFDFLEDKGAQEETLESRRYFEFGEYGLAFEAAWDAFETMGEPGEIEGVFERLREIMWPTISSEQKK